MGETYADGRRILDCDAHIMEPPGWLESFAPSSVRERLPIMDFGDPDFVAKIEHSIDAVEIRRTDTAERETAVAEFMTMPRKGWGALGDHDADERRTVLDLFGFERQLIFPTGSFPQAMAAPADIRVDAFEAMNRGLAAFAAIDERLLSTAYIPMPDVTTAMRVLRRAIDDGADTVAIDSIPPRDGISPSHPDFDPFWATVVEHGFPVMLHVGLDNGYRPVPAAVFENGREMPNFRSDAPGDAVSYMAIGMPGAIFISALLFDGVVTRHPGLRFGVTELGASWVPGFQQFLDSSWRSFRRMQDLSHLEDVPPSELLRRHFCFAPFAGENVGWAIEASSADLFMFASDYPHHEGSDDPIGRFERTMETIDDEAKRAFYARNFERLLTGA